MLAASSRLIQRYVWRCLCLCLCVVCCVLCIVCVQFHPMSLLAHSTHTEGTIPTFIFDVGHRPGRTSGPVGWRRLLLDVGLLYHHRCARSPDPVPSDRGCLLHWQYCHYAPAGKSANAYFMSVLSFSPLFSRSRVWWFLWPFSSVFPLAILECIVMLG